MAHRHDHQHNDIIADMREYIARAERRFGLVLLVVLIAIGAVLLLPMAAGLLALLT